MNIYDFIGEKFFTPLASKNKFIYMDTILFLNRLLSDLDQEQGNFKYRAVEELAIHLEDFHTVNIYNDEDILIDEKDNRVKANLIINKLIEYDWLVEESVGNGQRSLNFKNYALLFINTIIEIQENTKRQYSGYIRTIKSSINHFDYSKIDDFEIIDKELNALVVELRILQANLMAYYNNMIKNKDKTELKEILAEFTGDYKRNFYDSSYYNLKIRDKIDNELPRLTRALDDILANTLKMEMLIEARIDKDYDSATARLWVNKCKERIISNIRKLPNLITSIDDKNNKYITRTISVIYHKIKRGEDIEGVLNQVIDYVKDDVIEYDFMKIFKMKHYCFNALAKPKAKPNSLAPNMIEIGDGVSEDVIKETKRILEEEKRFSLDNVNKYVNDFLKGYRMRKISEANYLNNYDFLRIISIMMYSKLPKANYIIFSSDERINKNGVSFNDFTLVRKDDSYE